MSDPLPHNINTSKPDFSSWKNSQLFNGITDEQLNHLEGHLINKTYDKGEYIIKEGTFGDAIFFIEKGSAAILKDNVKLAENHAGEYFGAMALMENTTRSADVVASSPLEVKVLTINQLKAIESDDVFVKILTNHLKKQQDLIRDKNQTLIEVTKSKLESTEAQLRKTKLYYNIILLLVILIFGLLYHFFFMH